MKSFCDDDDGEEAVILLGFMFELPSSPWLSSKLGEKNKAPSLF